VIQVPIRACKSCFVVVRSGQVRPCGMQDHIMRRAFTTSEAARTTILYYALIRLIMETTYGFSQNASKTYDFVVFILPDYTNKGPNEAPAT
jgi:hypothetical protein